MRVAIGLIVLSTSLSTMAQEPAQGTMATLYAASHAGGMLSVDETRAQRTLTVDSARSVTIIVTSPVELEVGVVTPDGRKATIDNWDKERGRWLRYRNEGGASAVPMPGTAPGYNDFITLNAPSPGKYVIDLTRVRRGDKADPFVITLLEDSDVRMGLVVPTRGAVQGVPFVVAAVLMDADRPLVGAKILATIAREPEDRASPGIPVGDLPIRDDGDGIDVTRGDGMYTALVTPTALGRHYFAVRAEGTNAAGLAFERHAGFTVDVSAPTARIGRLEAMEWQRNPGSGNRLLLTTILSGKAGRFELVATFRGRNLRRVSANDLITLDTADATRHAMRIDAERFAALNVDGPFALETLELYEVDRKERVLRDRRVVNESTPAIRYGELVMR